MEPIPEPELLDADRLLLNCHDASPTAQRIVREVCAYGHQLWDQLSRNRRYLLDSTEQGYAHPVSPRDDAGWQRWAMTYADVTRVLAGPRGDAGFADTDARLEMRRRRSMDAPTRAAERGG